MTTDETLKLVRHMDPALDAHDIDAHDRCRRPDRLWHGPPGLGAIDGLDGFVSQVLRPFRVAFPDDHVVEEIEVADAATVSATGAVKGEWMGLAPTGRPTRMRFSDLGSVRDGLLHENCVMIDTVDVLAQLGQDLLATLPR
jgi:predicted ester cyclase